MERETAVEIRATCLRVHAVTTDGKHLAGLSGQLSAGAVVGRSVGEADDDSEQLRRCSAVIELTVPFRLNGNDIFIVCLQKVVVERPVLLEEIMKAIDDIVNQYEKVIFTGDFDSPFIVRDGYIYREIHDITDPLKIYVEDKSRGSDYGD